MCVELRELRVQDLLLTVVCWGDRWSSLEFRVSSSVKDSVGTLLFNNAVKEWTVQVNELWSPPSACLRCQKWDCLSYRWWLIVFDSAMASALHRFKLLGLLYCHQIHSLRPPNDKTDTHSRWMDINREFVSLNSPQVSELIKHSSDVGYFMKMKSHIPSLKGQYHGR